MWRWWGTKSTSMETETEPSKQNDDASKNPQSGEQLGLTASHSSQTDKNTAACCMEEEEEELKRQHSGGDYHHHLRQLKDSENGLDGEGELRKTLDEEIHQVIFKEALNEAVMNLALGDDRNATEYQVKLQNTINGYGIDSSGRAPVSGFEEGNSNEVNNIYEKEEGNEIKNEKPILESDVNGGESDIKGKSGDFPEKGLNGKDENESVEEEEEEDNYGTEGWESGGDYMMSNEDGGYTSRSYGGRRFLYPLRPEAEDCAYYVKTGNCKFGANCKFNHPPRRRNQGIKEKAKPKVEDSEQLGQTECKYYLTAGGCKFGKACKYSHSRERSAVAPILEFNFLGLPIRLGEKECPYYMRTGSCKYGSNCRFNHPDPTSVAGSDPTSGYGNGGSIQLQSAAQSSPSSWSSMPMMFPPTQVVPSSNPEWNGYQAPVYPTSDRSLPTPPAFAMNIPATEASFYSRHQQQMPVEEFPERPGQPECSYFIKTGDCKYKSNCRFHHPKPRISMSTSCALSDKGLPLRPDQSICSFYKRYGICKFGPACKFDHPENRGNSASSDGPRMEGGFS